VRFHGLQAQLWSETVRSDSQVEYLLFPRLLALAERAWHQAAWELPYRHEGHDYRFADGSFSAEHRTRRTRDWQRFAGLLATRELAKLARANIAFRLPTVGARIEAGQLLAHLPFRVDPDPANTVNNALAIEFRIDGGRWQRYRQPVPVSGVVDVRAVLLDTGRVGRSLTVPTSLSVGQRNPSTAVNAAPPATTPATTPTSINNDGFAAAHE
jgi:hexosaminidase